MRRGESAKSRPTFQREGGGRATHLRRGKVVAGGVEVDTRDDSRYLAFIDDGVRGQTTRRGHTHTSALVSAHVDVELS